jgi:hypothetical protein
MNRIFLMLTVCMGLQVAVVASGYQVNANFNCGGVRQGTAFPTGGPIIWPWGREVTIPWSGIQGVWQFSGTDCSKVFLFKIIKQTTTERVLEIIQYNPVSCTVIARGPGYESNRVIRAVLTGLQGPFELTIHAFKFNDVSSPYSRRSPYNRQPTQEPGPVMVMRVFPINGKPSPQTTFKIDRLETNPTMLCQ